jgi:polyisoprenoid-binding protein YceI
MSNVASVPTTTTTTWQIDPAHTHVEFAVRHMMISTVRGRFSEVSGSVAVPGGDFTQAQLQATISVASIDTRQEQRDAHLKSPDFFDVEKYPTMTFVSRRVESHGRADRFQLIGDLTIHGNTREIVLDVTLEGQTRDPYGFNRAGFVATGKLSRKDFGLTWNQALETGGVVVGDEIKITIDAQIIVKAE